MSENSRTRRGVDATGRTSGKFVDPRFRKANKPPGPFLWQTIEMLESPAWRALSIQARMILDRIGIEHHAHGGAENGSLAVTYDDFVKHGVRRADIRGAIAECVALGFLDVTRAGQRGWGAHKGKPTLFRIAWMASADGQPASARWRRIADLAEARAISAAAHKTEKPPPKVPKLATAKPSRMAAE